MRKAIFTLTLTLLLTACGAQGEPTPSGPPPLPDPVLVMYVLPPAPLEDESAVERVERALYDRTALSVDIRLVERAGELLEGICSSTLELPALAWMSGLSYIAAEARECGQPALQIARRPETMLPLLVAATSSVTVDAAGIEISTEETPESPAEPEADATAEATEDPASEATLEPTDEPTLEATETSDATPEADTDGTEEVDTETPTEEATPEPIAGEPQTGMAGQIIVYPRLGTTDLSAIVGRTFCRLGYDDLYSWLLPTLIFSTRNIDLLEDSTVINVATVPALVEAVASGECTMAGVAEGVLESLEMTDSVRVATTSQPLPHGVLVYAPEVQLGVRLTMDETLLEMAEDPDAAALWKPLLNQDAMLKAAPQDFDPLRDFLEATRLDFARLGN